MSIVHFSGTGTQRDYGELPLISVPESLESARTGRWLRGVVCSEEEEKVSGKMRVLRSAGVMRARLEKGKGRGKRWAVLASGFGLGWRFGEWWAGCRNGARPSWGALAGRQRAWRSMRLVEDEPLGGRSSFYFSKTETPVREKCTFSCENYYDWSGPRECVVYWYSIQ